MNGTIKIQPCSTKPPTKPRFSTPPCAGKVPGLLRWFFASHPRRSPWRCPVASTTDGGGYYSFFHGVIRTRKNWWFKNYELNESITGTVLLSAEFYTIHTHLYTDIYRKLEIPSPRQGICWCSTQTRPSSLSTARPWVSFSSPQPTGRAGEHQNISKAGSG